MSASRPSAAERWLAVGQSNAGDARSAAGDATDQALRGEDAKLLIVFSAERYDLNELLLGINERSGGIPLVGCSTAGEIAASGAGDASGVVTALGGKGGSDRLGRGRRHLVGCAARHRRQAWLDTGRRAHARHRERQQQGLQDRRPAGTGCVLGASGGSGSRPLESRRLHQICADASAW